MYTIILKLEDDVFIDYDFLDSLKKATDQIMARVCVGISSLSEKDIRIFFGP